MYVTTSYEWRLPRPRANCQHAYDAAKPLQTMNSDLSDFVLTVAALVRVSSIISRRSWSAETSYGLKCIKYKGSNLWNQLPSELKLITSINSFKCKLKTHINNLVQNHLYYLINPVFPAFTVYSVCFVHILAFILVAYLSVFLFVICITLLVVSVCNYHRWPAMMEFFHSGSLPLIVFVICYMLVIWQINFSLSLWWTMFASFVQRRTG